MQISRTARVATAAVLAVGLAVPVVSATAASGATTAVAVQASDHMRTGMKACKAEAMADHKAAMKDARHAKKAAYRDAREKFLADTAAERATRDAALAAATTDEEREAARQAFRDATASQRATRQASKHDARVTFKSSSRSAHKDFRDAMDLCRA